MSDYTDIQPELDDFENAVYGDEVRDSMISAIKKIYDIAKAGGDAPSGDSVPTEVRQAIFNLLDNNAFANDDTYTSDLAVLEAWASVATAITVSPSTASISGSSTRQLTAVTTPAGASVSWASSNTSVATVSSSGLVTGVGNGTCTITASCGGKSATCAVTVSGFATLLSINAVYTQSGTVYDTDTLDSLKSDLVVTANYDDQTSRTVTDYMLSGTLTEGTSTITVSYGGKTTTFNVTVSEVLPEPVDGAYAIWDARDYTTGNVWTDRINSITATPFGNPAKSGNAVLFDGTDDYFDVGALSMSTTYGSATIQTSFKLADLTGPSFVLADNVTSNSRITVSLRPSESIIRIQRNTLKLEYSYTFDSNWHMLTAVIGDKAQLIYVDDVLLKRSEYSFENGATLLNGASALKMGAYPAFNSYCNMYLRSLYIYPKTLSAEDVAQNYALESSLWE